MAIFSKNSIERRRSTLSNAWIDTLSSGEGVVVFSGLPITRPGGFDQNYPFLPHPCYYWLTGSRRHGGVVVFSKETGFVDFDLPVSRVEALWEGELAEPLTGRDVSTLEEYLKGQKFNRVYAFGQYQNAPVSLALTTSGEEFAKLKEKFDSIRRKKDEEEIALLKKTVAAAKFGYDKLKEVIGAGVSEIFVRAEYESTIQKNGAHTVPYETIVGSGYRGGILHAPATERILKKGETVLIDAGADIYDYCCDVTRVFPVSGAFTTRQSEIYNIVLTAQKKVISMCGPGVEMRDLHTTAAREMAEGLKQLGILRGETDSLLQSEAIAMFFPHGLGHLVGLRVRDAGNEENRHPKKVCGAFLRLDRKLEEKQYVTMEPGLYFIDKMINDAQNRSRFKDQVNFSEAEKWLDFGGVRIEDDVLIQSSGHEVLTAAISK